MLDKVAIMNKAREKYRHEHCEKVRQQAELSFEQFKNDPLFVAGIMLYWAEGMTSEARGSNHQLALSNADYRLLQVYCNFFRRYFNHIGKKIGARLFLYPGIDEDKAIKFWAKKLNISFEQFGRSTILKSRTRITKNRLPYGTCSVFINSRDSRVAMEVWINRFVNMRA